MADPRIIWQYLQARFNLDLDRSDDSGLVTSEMAVAAFLLVAGAIIVIGLLMAAAEDNAANVPVPSP
jgi:hypothetical protein